MSLTLAAARSIADATLAEARRLDAAPLAVAVLDAGGHSVVLHREDGAGYLRVDVATAKAWGALGMGQPSRQLARRAVDNPEFFNSLVAVSGGRVGLSAGGVLCLDASGAVVSAVGVSGDTPDVDEQCAVAGIAAGGLRAVTGGDATSQ